MITDSLTAFSFVIQQQACIMNKNLTSNYVIQEKIRVISNQEIAYDLLELQDMLTLPMNTCLHILYHRLSTNEIEATC